MVCRNKMIGCQMNAAVNLPDDNSRFHVLMVDFCCEKLLQVDLQSFFQPLQAGVVEDDLLEVGNVSDRLVKLGYDLCFKGVKRGSSLFDVRQCILIHAQKRQALFHAFAHFGNVSCVGSFHILIPWLCFLCKKLHADLRILHFIDLLKN